jgi:hypothetical protein
LEQNANVGKKFAYVRTKEAVVSSSGESLLSVKVKVETELQHNVHIRINVQDVLAVGD